MIMHLCIFNHILLFYISGGGNTPTFYILNIYNKLKGISYDKVNRSRFGFCYS